MTKVLYGTLLALALGAAVPAAAQGIYVGPNGVGVDTGAHRIYRDHDRDNDTNYYRDRDRHEGRSVYDRDRRNSDDD